MKSFGVILLAAACACFALVEATSRLFEKEGHLNDMRERLGHFSQQPFIDLYKQYAVAFVYPLHKGQRDPDDYRNYMPSGAECMTFFRQLRGSDYNLNDLKNLVLMDACLGYLFDSDNHDLDTETSDEAKKNLVTLKEDKKLISFYESTVNDLSKMSKKCVADLLLNNILAVKDYPDVTCNNHFLQLFIQFAECQSQSDLLSYRETDPYVKAIYDLVEKRVRTCFDVEIGHINSAFRKAFVRSKATRAKLVVSSRVDSLAKQQRERMWPSEVTTLLAAVQNTSKAVNVRRVHELVHGVYTNDVDIVQIFLDNVAHYATKTLNPRPNSKSGKKDPSGYERYVNLVDDLCSFFRSSDNERDYDFATPLIRMVELLNYENLFGLTKDDFVQKLLTHSRETAPLYMCVSVCNLLTYTEGTIQETAGNAVRKYVVKFQPDTSRMVKWPDAGFY